MNSPVIDLPPAHRKRSLRTVGRVATARCPFVAPRSALAEARVIRRVASLRRDEVIETNWLNLETGEIIYATPVAHKRDPRWIRCMEAAYARSEAWAKRQGFQFTPRHGWSK